MSGTNKLSLSWPVASVVNTLSLTRLATVSAIQVKFRALVQAAAGWLAFAGHDTLSSGWA
jgi:hypothetical protein